MEETETVTRRGGPRRRGSVVEPHTIYSLLSVRASPATVPLVHHLPATLAFLLLECEVLCCLKALALAVPSST